MRRHAGETRPLARLMKPSDRMIRFSVELGKDKFAALGKSVQGRQHH